MNTATMQTPDSPRKGERAPWETDPDAWRGEDQETPAQAVERLLEEVAGL